MISTTAETRSAAGAKLLRGGTLTVLRIGAGLLFLQHGVQKLFGLLGGVDGQGGTANLFSIFGLAGIFEVFGSLALILGLLTRPVALVLAAEMVTAYFLVHHGQGGFPIQNGGEVPLFFALVFSYIAANGGGTIGVDRILANRRKAAPELPV
ncbi:MAG TPA: DoxX family protein [Longimicrobiales bacterium]|nr:DoxX family protein [Longimicrobiales bacterium]